MRDLYKQLGVARDADPAELNRALEDHPDLAGVLLNPEKRRVYDSAHGTLKLIGSLRYRLGLDSGASWFLETCEDFSPRQAAAPTPRTGTPAGREASAGPSSTTPPKPGPRPRKDSERRWPTALWLAIAILVLAAIVFYNR